MSEQTQTPTENATAAPQNFGPAGTASDPIPIRQMNQKALGIDPKAVRKMPKGSMMKLGVFFGVVEGIKTVESRYGDTNSMFIGEFRAIHPLTGKFFYSEKAFFFGAVSQKLAATFHSGGGKPVEFAYEISSQEDETAQIGYTYVAVTLIPTVASSRVDSIAQAIEAKMLERAQALAPAAPMAEIAASAEDSKAAAQPEEVQDKAAKKKR